ncbi:hypothetical protein BCR33DRAFT_848673 [Rhizoclosmatium globosum]|uniref:Gfd2/YDR514C-like C-terminal domain-containing protein n=1 Tax=Rhizoclosmatium globosum TaxID=329046 RepID=A0A1Y2CJW2_9FUNG|nr:hypothetical protein BCR33DRAFT_848673 [Rhizoclosmatium globosum]|eukprot:ORY47302.1 hypothetical protein BCR33DRAFT_848673 [Rhizoclosmatium globosum]
MSHRWQVALDLEWYDQSQGDHLTEVGLAVKTDAGIKHFHFSVKEHSHLLSRYAPFSSSGFVFGATQVLPLKQVKDNLIFYLTGGLDSVDVDLVWHNPVQDRKVLAKNGIIINELVPIERQFDTGVLFGGKPRKLSAILDALQIPYSKAALHDAGNDAAYTLLAYLAMKPLLDDV